MVRLCWVSDVHARRFMRSGIMFFPPHVFDHPSWWYYRLRDVKKCDYGVVAHGINTVPNLISFLLSILQL